MVQDFFRIEDTDFHFSGTFATQFAIRCKFDGLSEADRGFFAEHLTFENNKAVPFLNLPDYPRNLASRSRR